MTEPEGTVEPTTAAPAPVEPAAQTETTTEPQETSTLTLDQVKALIEERDVLIRKETEQAYKTLRRGEAKSDTALKRIEKLETELLEVSLKGLDPDKAEVERLKRQVQRDVESRTADPQQEVTAFQGWSASLLEEEGIDPKDPTLAEAFGKYGEGWQSQADLRVALTRSIAKVHAERTKAARAESADREKKAREDERAKLRNENRQAEGKVDKGTPASATPASKNILSMTPEEWTAFNASRVRR